MPVHSPSVSRHFGPGSNPIRPVPQLTAFVTSALILASSVAVNSFSAKATGHRAPSSSFAVSLKPNVAYLVLNFCAGWKWQTTSPSLAYAGIPYQVLGERAGALALMIEWSRLAMARSGSRIAAMLASASRSPSAFPPAAFTSRARSVIAARSSAVNTLVPLPLVLFPDFCVSFIGVSSPASIDGYEPHGRVPAAAAASRKLLDRIAHN